jgi:hypothetical protein
MDDMRMHQGDEQAGFGEQAVQGAGIEGTVQDLEGDLGVQIAMRAQQNVSERTCTNEPV